jgi:Flp pilus assembly protein TadB
MSAPDPHDALQDDLQKVRRARNRDSFFDGGFAAWFEAIGATLTALVGLAWFGLMFLVPDVISGTTWMGIGMFGLILLGGPTGLVYWLRRGGGRTVLRIVRQFAR